MPSELLTAPILIVISMLNFILKCYSPRGNSTKPIPLFNPSIFQLSFFLSFFVINNFSPCSPPPEYQLLIWFFLSCLFKSESSRGSSTTRLSGCPGLPASLHCGKICKRIFLIWKTLPFPYKPPLISRHLQGTSEFRHILGTYLRIVKTNPLILATP